ncbi:MerR family transcriptional regulator [Oceanobacillus kapialis]|uniref:MerR family transcriptional regulator n=1 Tax=Oceanobacillus kapialis TaxID=481353 RepID=UPI00384A9A43
MQSIGNIAKEMNLTVRTLRFYDEINLLKPSHIADSGYRYYSKRDVLKLYRIIALKELGFHLHQIKTILNQNDWENVFEEQLAIIAKEKERLGYQEKLLRLCMHLSLIEHDISWKSIFQHHKRPTEERDQEIIAYYKEHFDDREMEILKNPSLDIGSNASRELVELLRAAREQKRDDPHSPKSQSLAKRLMTFLDHSFEGNSALVEKFWDIQKLTIEDAGLITIEKDVVQYIDDVMDIYEAKLKENGQ